MNDELRRLFDDPVFRAYHAEPANQRTFSTFDVLRYSDYEIRHSNVLAWLLQPAETHRIGAHFLSRFVERVNAGLPEDDRSPIPDALFNAANVDVWRERDYVDVTIRFKREKWLIVVENKIGPAQSDHLGQVMAYCREQKRRHDDHTVTGVLLSTSPDGSVRIDDLVRRVAEARRFRRVVHVGWDFVREEVDSLHRNGEFPSPDVQAFIRQYLELVAKWFRGDGGRGFQALFDDHRPILKELRRILEKEGSEGVHRMVPKDRADHARSLVRLVKETRHDPKKLRTAANKLLKSRGVRKRVSSHNPRQTAYWLRWTDPSLADATETTGGPRGSVGWALIFSRHRVEIGFRLRYYDESRPFLAWLERFMEMTPINRRKRDEHALEDLGFSWKKGYRVDLISGEEMFEMSSSEAEEEVRRRLADFMDSDDSEYRRIDDYFQCLAARFDPAELAGDGDRQDA